jgi:uracil-DNA glycosylase family 4
VGVGVREHEAVKTAPAEPALAPGAPRDPARSQRELDRLRARYEQDAPHKQFVTAHTNIVFGEGDPCARLMFIGEAPGAEEDRTGRPFVGRAGQLLEKMIGAMGLDRSRVYIANVLKTRPPDNATPTSEEIRICAPYLFEQIGIIRPEAIVALGLPATRALLGSADSMSRLRGQWTPFKLPAPLEGVFPVMPTYHPAFLLRSYTAENRAKVWSDLQQVMTRLGLARVTEAAFVPGA